MLEAHARISIWYIINILSMLRITKKMVQKNSMCVGARVQLLIPTYQILVYFPDEPFLTLSQARSRAIN